MTETKQQLVTERRGQILNAAARVFAAKGFHPTTIKDIARDAGIADGTVYIYFENKSALLIGIFDRLQESARREVDPTQFAGMDLHQFVRTFLQRPLTVFEAGNFDLFRVVLAEIMVNKDLRDQFQAHILGPMIEIAEQYFQVWAKQNGVPSDRATLVIHTISSMVLGLIVQRILGDPMLKANWEQLPDVISDVLVHGIEGSRS